MSNEREDIEMNIKKLRELKKNKKGFTLIEIIVVIVILAVLMAVAVPSVLKYLDSADNAKYMAQARSVMTTTQIELVNAYTGDHKITKNEYDAAIQNVKDELKKDDVTISSITIYTGTVKNVKDESGKITFEGAVEVEAPTGETEDTSLKEMPNITAYKVVFENKQALVVVNGSVSVGDTVTLTTTSVNP